MPIAYPAPVLNGGYHILCLENPGLFGLYKPAAPPVAQLSLIHICKSGYSILVISFKDNIVIMPALIYEIFL